MSRKLQCVYLFSILMGSYYAAATVFAMTPRVISIGVQYSKSEIKQFCSGTIDTDKLWKIGFYYSQVEGTWFTPPPGVKFESIFAAMRSLGFNRDDFKNGKSLTECPNGSYFKLVRANSLGVSEYNGVLRISGSIECNGGVKGLHVSTKGVFKSVDIDNSTNVNISKLEDGYLSLSCHETESDQIGREFYLRPIGSASFKFAKNFEFDTSKHKSIGEWTNHVRNQLKLSPTVSMH